MKLVFIFISLLLLLVFNINFGFCVQEKVDGLEYGIRKIEDAPLERYIQKNYDIYELYFENRSNKTYSIPGYSIDLRVDYSTLNDINAIYKDMSSKKLAVFNIAAGAASIALGGIAKTASNAVRSVGSFRRKNILTEDGFLSISKTYILYPGDAVSIFFFINKYLQQIPNSIRFICRDEDISTNYVVINNKIHVNEPNAKNDSEKNVISAPSSEQYR